jgi:hypothetical protein
MARLQLARRGQVEQAHGFARVEAGAGPSRLETEGFEEQGQSFRDVAAARVEPPNTSYQGALSDGREHLTVLVDGFWDATGRRMGAGEIDPREAMPGSRVTARVQSVTESTPDGAADRRRGPEHDGSLTASAFGEGRSRRTKRGGVPAASPPRASTYLSHERRASMKKSRTPRRGVGDPGYRLTRSGCTATGCRRLLPARSLGAPAGRARARGTAGHGMKQSAVAAWKRRLVR